MVDLQEAIFRVVASVLHLGNIEFVAGSDSDTSKLKDDQSKFHLEAAAELLQWVLFIVSEVICSFPRAAMHFPLVVSISTSKCHVFLLYHLIFVTNGLWFCYWISNIVLLILIDVKRKDCWIHYVPEFLLPVMAISRWPWIRNRLPSTGILWRRQFTLACLTGTSYTEQFTNDFSLLFEYCWLVALHTPQHSSPVFNMLEASKSFMVNSKQSLISHCFKVGGQSKQIYWSRSRFSVLGWCVGYLRIWKLQVQQVSSNFINFQVF